MAPSPTTPQSTNPWFLARVMAVAGAAASLVALAVAGPWLANWRVITLAALAAVLLLSAPLLRRLTSRRPPPSAVFAGLLVGQALFIGATGGAASPFVVVLIPPAILVGVLGLRRLNWYPPAMAALLAVFLVIELIPALRGVLPAASLGGVRPLLGLSVFIALLIGIIMGGFRVGRRARQRLDEANARLVEAQRERAATLAQGNADLFALTGAIAHELKNPITTLLSLSSFLERRSAQYGLEREARVMVEEVRRMRRQVEELLNLSRPAEALARQQLDLEGLINATIAAHSELARAAGIELTATAAPVALSGDQRKLRQVLDNLVQNALEASAEGGTVRLVVAQSEDGVQLDVLDRGPGLPDQLAGRLFQLGHTTKPTGSGIGLTISRLIVEQHGGKLTLQNRADGGCQARVTLPLAPPRDEQACG